VREGLEVKLCTGPDGTETFVLCRSAEREKKEKAMHERFAKRIEEGLASLGRRIDKSKKALEKGPIDRQIGRLLGENPRAAGRYTVTLRDDPDAPAKLRLHWSVRSDWEDWARLHEGCYVLRTNVNDWTPEKRAELGSSPRTVDACAMLLDLGLRRANEKQERTGVESEPSHGRRTAGLTARRRLLLALACGSPLMR
jgi:hypothetical protein